MKKVQKMIMMAAVCAAVGMMGVCAQAQEETEIQTQEAADQAENLEDGTAAREEQQTEGDAGQVASPDEMVSPEDVVEDWMVPGGELPADSGEWADERSDDHGRHRVSESIYGHRGGGGRGL